MLLLCLIERIYYYIVLYLSSSMFQIMIEKLKSNKNVFKNETFWNQTWICSISTFLARCPFHQRFFARIFRLYVDLAVFFKLHVSYMYVEKAAKTTFVRKKRVKNFDEIDDRQQFFCILYFKLGSQSSNYFTNFEILI